METALNPERREVWVGLPTVITILANKLAPGVLDRYLARTGYSGRVPIRRGKHDARPLDVLARPIAVACDRRQLLTFRSAHNHTHHLSHGPFPQDLAQYCVP